MEDRVAKLIVQELPKKRYADDKTTLDILTTCGIEYLEKKGITLFAGISNKWFETLDYCEDAWERGYSAIINDGLLLGFREE